MRDDHLLTELYKVGRPVERRVLGCCGGDEVEKIGCGLCEDAAVIRLSKATKIVGQSHVRTQNFSLGGWGGAADPKAVYNLFDFKNCYKNRVVSTS
jgi:hypothetical protein